MNRSTIFLALVALLAWGCGDDNGGAQGTVGNACYGNGTCNTGLVCSGGTCVAMGGGEMGTLGNACYGNGTCNAGLECMSGVCLEPGSPPPTGDGGGPPPTGDGGGPGDSGGPPPTGDGGMGGECTADMSDDVRRPWPAACLPRCAAGTLSAIRACQETGMMTMDFIAQDVCIQEALDLDPTPSVVFTDSGSGEGFDLDCRFCYFGAADICNDMFCLEQSRAARSCMPDMDCTFMRDADDMAGRSCCNDEYDALDACTLATDGAHSRCLIEQEESCFGM